MLCILLRRLSNRSTLLLSFKTFDTHFLIIFPVMKVSQLLSVALWAIPGAVATLEWNGNQCQWYGNAPNCGAAGDDPDELDTRLGRKTLVITTEHQDKRAACDKLGFKPAYVRFGFTTVRGDNRCEDEYGSGCLFGYKRLWCNLK